MQSNYENSMNNQNTIDIAIKDLTCSDVTGYCKKCLWFIFVVNVFFFFLQHNGILKWKKKATIGKFGNELVPVQSTDKLMIQGLS